MSDDAIATLLLQLAGKDERIAELQCEADRFARDVVMWNQQLDEKDARIIALESRQDEHLALIAKLSRETPYDDEIKGWINQRRKVIAEVGTLRAALTSKDAHLASMQARIDGLEGRINGASRGGE